MLHGHAVLTPLGGVGEESAGYKGYGYGTMVEILSAALQNGKFLKMLSAMMMKGTGFPITLATSLLP
jgi:L-2-hydroxycarboxylate dehydrogenase (NAD+)